jgi:branched-chain amino acid transport system substrate-binding protein
MLAAVLLAGCGGNAAKTSDTPAASSPAASSSAPSEAPAPSSNIDPNKNTIRIGMARPESGVYEVFEQTVFGPIYKMWVDEVNANGGLYIKEYDKKMPIEIIRYDDGSDMETMVRLSEKLMTEDKVDFMFPSCSTAFLFAQAEITNKYGYLLFGAEGGAAELSKTYDKYPLFFSPVNHSTTQMPALVEVLKQQGVKTAYIVYIEDLHGLEYYNAATPLLKDAGIDVLGAKSVPPDINDLTPVITAAKDSNADAFLMFCYPDQNFPATFVAMQIGYNPKVFLFGPGMSMDAFPYGVLGDPALAEGCMGFGAWNAKSGTGAAEFVAKFKEKWPDIGLEWWGHLPDYCALQIFEQAVVGAGTLDNVKVAEYMKNNKFQTYMGEIWFTNNTIDEACWLGNVGQWQNGVYEVIDVDANRRTADPIYPKPAWPAP